MRTWDVESTAATWKPKYLAAGILELGLVNAVMTNKHLRPTWLRNAIYMIKETN
jgi:hypothetical protein